MTARPGHFYIKTTGDMHINIRWRVASAASITATTITDIYSNVHTIIAGDEGSNILHEDTSDVWCLVDTLPSVYKQVTGGAPTGTAAGDLSGAYPSPTVIAVQGQAVHTAAPADQEVMTWSATESRWEAAAAAGGSPTGAAGGGLSGTYPNPTVDGLNAVGVSADDTTPGDLEAKVVGGSNVTIATLNPGANEQLEISATQATAVTMAGDVTGPSGTSVVGAIQGQTVHTTAPTDAQVLTWDNGNTRWAAADAAGGGGSRVIRLEAHGRCDMGGSTWDGPDGVTTTWLDAGWTASYGATSGDATANNGRHMMTVPFDGTITSFHVSAEIKAALTASFTLLRMRPAFDATSGETEAIAIAKTDHVITTSSSPHFWSTENADFTIITAGSANAVLAGDELFALVGSATSATGSIFRYSVEVTES